MAKVKLEVMTPEKLIYRGDVDSVTVKTCDGDEGFLAGHVWCCKLLAKDGAIRIREDAGKTKKAKLKGGCVYVRSDIIVFCDQAEWVS